MTCVRALFLAAGLAASLAGCASDGGSSGISSAGGGGGGSPIPILSTAPELGLGGAGGLSEDLLGQDVVGVLLSDGPGPVPAVLAGGEEEILGSLGDAGSALPDLPTLPVTELPLSLGVTRPGGLVEDLAGQDALGAAIGAPGGMVPVNEGIVPLALAGGNDGLLGSVVPPGSSSGLAAIPVLGALLGPAQ